MNKEDLILQKLESMDADLKVVRSEVKDVRVEVKDVRVEVTDRIDKIKSKLEVVNADFAEMKVNQIKFAGDLHTFDVKVTGKLETLETKLDGFITQVQDQKGDTNEHWKVGGIIVSFGVATVSLILSILTRMGQ